MALTKEEKLELSKMHDLFVHPYNRFIDALNQKLVDRAEQFTDLERADIVRIQLYQKMIRQNIHAMDELIAQLDAYHRTFTVTKTILKEAANRPIILD